MEINLILNYALLSLNGFEVIALTGVEREKRERVSTSIQGKTIIWYVVILDGIIFLCALMLFTCSMVDFCTPHINACLSFQCLYPIISSLDHVIRVILTFLINSVFRGMRVI